MMTLSGPMFEPSEWGNWKSVHKKSGAHYNNYGCRDENGMATIRELFEDGEADEMNFCLFSTSGVHGTYNTIEESYAHFTGQSKNEDSYPDITFVIVQPRICCIRHGNCIPKSENDYEFLKKLRKSSWEVVQKIGR